MKHRGWMVGIALIAALAAGLGAGYVIWGWPTNWYARDVTNLPASPENDIIRYGHSLIVEAAGPAGCCIRAALAAVHLGRLFGETDDQLAQFRRPIERQEMAAMRVASFAHRGSLCGHARALTAAPNLARPRRAGQEPRCVRSPWSRSPMSWRCAAG